MDDERAQLVLDESLFLQALKTLAEQEDRFELLHLVHTYVRESYIASRFVTNVGREISAAEQDAIEHYVAVVYLVHHHRASLGDLAEMRDQFIGPAMEFIRAAAWAFMSAWSLRYGGLYAGQLVRGTLVDPSA